MTIVNPLSSSVQVQPSATTPVTTAEERQVDLRMEQIVRATVVEGGLDRTVLELNHRHYRAQSDPELQAGQKLTLQVMQTHPRLEFRVLNDPVSGRLNQGLPLLARPYDWGQLVNQLQQQPQVQLPPAQRQMYQQLQQLLQPGGQPADGLGAEVVRLAGQVRQLALPFAAELDSSRLTLPASSVARAVSQGPAGVSADLLVTPLLRGLHQQLRQLPENSGRPLPQGWVAATRNLLSPVSLSGRPFSQVPSVQLHELATLVSQVQQQPQLPAQFSGELEGLLARLSVAQRLAASAQAALPRSQVTAHPGAPTQSPTLPAAQAPTAAQGPILGAVAEMLPAAAGSAAPQVATKDVSDGLEQLLAQVKQLQTEKGSLPVGLSGRLEALLARLEQLPQPATTGTTVLPGLELLTAQLTQLVQQEVFRPPGGQLGLFSQLFGFHLEAELLNGKTKGALHSLKLSLLDLREEQGETVKEPLQRLEVLQLCKARLAEEQVQFLPLLSPELEEGYLLVEKRREAGEGQEAESPLQLSISLRLAALGDLRIDMLYEQQGLHLRVACENQEKMTYLQGCTAELTAALETVPLQGVSFAADAKQPIRSLRERLVPEALGMLDARI